MTNSADPDQFKQCRSQLIWIYIVCKGRVYLGSAVQGLGRDSYTREANSFLAEWSAYEMGGKNFKLRVLSLWSASKVLHSLTSCIFMCLSCESWGYFSPLRKQAYSNILKIFFTKKWKFSDKNSDIFSYFCWKHTLWVLVRTASVRQF